MRSQGVNEAIGDLETVRRTTEADQEAATESRAEAFRLTSEVSQLR